MYAPPKPPLGPQAPNLGGAAAPSPPPPDPPAVVEFTLVSYGSDTLSGASDTTTIPSLTVPANSSYAIIGVVVNDPGPGQGSVGTDITGGTLVPSGSWYPRAGYIQSARRYVRVYTNTAGSGGATGTVVFTHTTDPARSLQDFVWMLVSVTGVEEVADDDGLLEYALLSWNDGTSTDRTLTLASDPTPNPVLTFLHLEQQRSPSVDADYTSFGINVDSSNTRRLTGAYAVESDDDTITWGYTGGNSQGAIHGLVWRAA